jgi:hypothetical protein
LIFRADWQKLKEQGVELEKEVLRRTISYFGSLALGLLRHINEPNACFLLMNLSEEFDEHN